jgi:ABC-2 type transport system permease protein
MKLSLYTMIARLEMRKLVSYRFEFLSSLLLNGTVGIVTSYFIWSAIFATSGESYIGGFTFEQMMLYSVIASLVGVVAQPEWDSTAFEIYEGSFTRYLLYPLSPLFYKFACFWGRMLNGGGQALVTLALVIVVSSYAREHFFHFDSMVQGLLATLLAGSLFFWIVLPIELSALWFEKVWPLVAIAIFFVRLCGGRLLPLTVFPDWARILLEILPFSSIIWFPAQAWLGTLSWSHFFLECSKALFWIGAFIGISHAIFNRGSRGYTAVGL